ncbi:hypothetical protein PPGU19_058220 [Paraburkholderia sp. PGU19]|nr:hypothetical protein PPGU19_058220 [Paraburkholderia sp. PGU19]
MRAGKFILCELCGAFRLCGRDDSRRIGQNHKERRAARNGLTGLHTHLLYARYVRQIYGRYIGRRGGDHAVCMHRARDHAAGGRNCLNRSDRRIVRTRMHADESHGNCDGSDCGVSE